MQCHLERTVQVDAAPAEVFARLDAQTQEHAVTANTVDEVVTDRVFPLHKAWIARATRLGVIDAYRMGFDLAAAEGGTKLKVWIDYRPSVWSFARWVGPLLAAVYARWRVDDLAQDATDSFTDMSVAVAAHP